MEYAMDLKRMIVVTMCLAALGQGLFAQGEPPMFFDRELNGGRLSDPVFSPDGKRIATVLHTSDGRDKNKINRMIALWDAANGREIRRLPGHNGNGIPSLAYSPDGRRLISGAVDGTVIVWNTETGGKVWNTTTPKEIYHPVYSPDGNRIAVIIPGDSGYSIKIWDAASGAEIRTLSGNGAVIRSVAYSPDGRRIAASVARNIKIWDAGTGQELRTVNGTQNFFDAVYSPDGRRIAGMHGRRGNSVKIYDAESGQELRDISTGGDIYSVGYGAGGREVLVNTGDDNENYVVKAVDTETGRELRIINVGSYEAAFSGDGKLILTLPDSINTADGSTICSWAEVWDASSGRRLLAVGYGPLNAGARAYADMQVARFLGDTAMAARHEGILQFITGRGNATRAEVEAFYRQNVGASIAGAVDEALKKRKPDAVPTANTARMINTLVKTSFTNFFLTPNQPNFNKLKKIYQVFNENYLVDWWNTAKAAKQNAEIFQKMGYTNSVASARELARTTETKLSGWLRELGVTYSEDIDWEMVWAAFYNSLEPIHTELAIRIRGY
jgi:hypothetical protein